MLIVKELERLSMSCDALREQSLVNNNRLSREIEEVAKEMRKDLAEFKDEEFSKIKIQLAMLQVRAGLIGAVTAIVASAVVSAIFLKFIHP